ncbi:MAG: hypothetical protein GXY07_12560 [Candidatus Hydrogenedentes bacterium]|nr:hypothetical protein [Candidatus Hydrogenedentota bacterium]
MKHLIFCGVTIACLFMAGCQTDSGVSVTDKVLADFGLREHPEGYVTGSDRVFQELDKVGATEMKRLNGLERHGEVKFDDQGRRGQYYKEVKVYESYLPMDVSGTPGGGTRDRGYSGIIQYKYRILRGEARPTKAEAAAQSATIPYGDEGRENYRYSFSTSGVWDGATGESTRD